MKAMNTAPWTEGAACRQIDPDLWFPNHGESGREAKAICNTCDVQTECLDDALRHEANDPGDYRWGIRGALDAKERRALALGISPHHGTMRGWREHVEQEQTPCRRCELAKLTSLRRQQQKAPLPPSQRKASS